MDEQRGESEEANGGLAARLARLEERVDRLGRELRTRRLVLLDEQDAERLVAEVTDRVVLLRLLLSGDRPPGDGLVLFAAPATEDLPPGCGLQVWQDGELVTFLEWWESD